MFEYSAREAKRSSLLALHPHVYSSGQVISGRHTVHPTDNATHTNSKWEPHRRTKSMESSGALVPTCQRHNEALINAMVFRPAALQ